MCEKCEVLDKIFKDKIKSNYDYWLYTELFVFMHDGCDHHDNKLKGFNEKNKIL